jgi:hypothetical protein
MKPSINPSHSQNKPWQRDVHPPRQGISKAIPDRIIFLQCLTGKHPSDMLTTVYMKKGS